MFSTMLNFSQNIISYFGIFASTMLDILTGTLGDLPVVSSIKDWAIYDLLPTSVKQVLINFVFGSDAPSIVELLFTTFVPFFLALCVIKWFTSIIF